jgi:hypothetical protein
VNFKLFITITIFLLAITGILYTETVSAQDFTITENSAGFVKIGKSLKLNQKKASALGYKIKKNDVFYTMYDEEKLPLLTFTVFSSHPDTNPVRTINVTSSKYKLDNGISLITATLSSLSKYYNDISIFKLNENNKSKELLDIKDWLFSKSIIKEGFILKYETTLGKITDEYGNKLSAGVYENNFALFTTNFIPEARVETFQIEAIEPNVKLEK